MNHPQHGRTVVVPYPVFYGGYSGYGSGYDPSAGYPPDQVGPNYSNGTPSVVINQNYIPPQANPSVQNYGPADGAAEPTMRLYQAPPSHPYADALESARRPPVSDQPTLYLIAFKDHTIVQASRKSKSVSCRFSTHSIRSKFKFLGSPSNSTTR